jgi:battenin
LGLVYTLEYAITVGCASEANPDYETSNNWFIKNSYAILSFCYQLGVFLSRSSLDLFKVPRKFIWLITVVQFANFVLWLLQIYVSLVLLLFFRLILILI